jgi:hypothetical protein
MSKYEILKARVGTVGEEYNAEAAAATGVNIDALIAGGFIKLSAPKVKKYVKTEEETEQEK